MPSAHVLSLYVQLSENKYWVGEKDMPRHAPFGYKTDPDNFSKWLLSFTVFRGSLNYILKLIADDINCILNIQELRPEHLLRLYGHHSSYKREPGVKSLHILNTLKLCILSIWCICVTYGSHNTVDFFSKQHVTQGPKVFSKFTSDNSLTHYGQTFR